MFYINFHTIILTPYPVALKGKMSSSIIRGCSIGAQGDHVVQGINLNSPACSCSFLYSHQSIMHFLFFCGATPNDTQGLFQGFY